MRIGNHRVQVGTASTDDWWILVELASGEYAAVDFDGATVVDIGAHKGYFAAFAFSRGAARVTSYEPAPANLAPLTQSAADDPNWSVVGAAVAAVSGNARLALVGAGTHTTLSDRHAQADVVEVPAVTLAEVVAAVEAGDRVVMKMDIEGAEAEVLRAAPPEAWQKVDELIVEVHRWACEPEDIVEILGPNWLVAEERDNGITAVLHCKRSTRA